MTFARLLTALGYKPANLGQTHTIVFRVVGQPNHTFAMTNEEMKELFIMQHDPSLDPDWSDGFCVTPRGEELEFLIESV